MKNVFPTNELFVTYETTRGVISWFSPGHTGSDPVGNSLTNTEVITIAERIAERLGCGVLSVCIEDPGGEDK
jgi:hypothetical protein